MDRFLDVAQLLTPAKAASGEIDVQDIVFSHIQDAYTWHITEWNGQEIAIPLPILVKSEERGWDYSCHPIYIKAGRITIIISPGKVSMRERLLRRTVPEKRFARWISH